MAIVHQNQEYTYNSDHYQFLSNLPNIIQYVGFLIFCCYYIKQESKCILSVSLPACFPVEAQKLSSNFPLIYFQEEI